MSWSAYPLCGMPDYAASTGGFVSAGAAGKVKWNVAPRPPAPLAQSRPPCDSTIDLLIARPMPEPCGFVSTNTVLKLLRAAEAEAALISKWSGESGLLIPYGPSQMVASE